MKLPVFLLVIAALINVRAADPQTKPEAPHAQPAAGAVAVKTVDVAKFEKLRSSKTNVVLDVRTPKEFAGGHIPGAVNIDVNAPDFEKKVAALDANKTYLVHCAAGGRGANACDKLGKLNFGKVYNLEGGFRAWEKAGNKPQR